MKPTSSSFEYPRTTYYRDRELLIDKLRGTSGKVCHKTQYNRLFWISGYPDHIVERTLAISAIREGIIVPCDMSTEEFCVQFALGSLKDDIVYFFELAEKFRC